MRIGIISCVKTKLKTNNPVEARALYTSSLFKFSLEYCLSNYDSVFILSAKYGVLKLTDLVLPYEKTLNNMPTQEKIIWQKNAKQKLESFINPSDELYFHCGENYRSALISELKNPSFIPLKGVPFGKQLQFYKNKNNLNYKLNL